MSTGNEQLDTWITQKTVLIVELSNQKRLIGKFKSIGDVWITFIPKNFEGEHYEDVIVLSVSNICSIEEF